MDSKLQEFFALLKEAGILSASKLTELKSSFSGNPTVRPEDMATELLQVGGLTEFQATEISNGHTQKLIVGEYILLDHIARGGMGQVFRARHCVMQRDVAIKFMLPSHEDDDETSKRFRREVQTASKLSHPHIVTALDAGQRDGMCYLVMEYVDGVTLSKFVQTRGPMSVDQTVDCILQAALGLEYSHEHGIVHRDIKPTNLLLTNDGKIKILDMGLARIQPAISSSADPELDQLTEKGQLLGTIDFMAPEQALDPRGVDKRADIYSLGCTMYYLLTGESPFHGDSATTRLVAHRESPIPTLFDVRPDIPNALDQCFFRMMAKDVKDRYQDMGDVIRDLRACSRIVKGLNQDTEDTVVWTEGHGDPRSAAKQNWRRIALVAGILLVLTSAGWAVNHWMANPAGSRERAVPSENGEDGPEAIAIPIVLDAFPADLLKFVDSERDVEAGTDWEFSESKILTGLGKAARFQIPVKSPKEYLLKLKATRKEGFGPLVIGLVVGENQCHVLLDRSGDSGIGLRFNHMIQKSEEITLPTDTPVAIECRVADSRIEVSLDGVSVLSYEGDFAELHVPAGYRMSRKDVPFLATNHTRDGEATRFEITEMTLDRLDSPE